MTELDAIRDRHYRYIVFTDGREVCACERVYPCDTAIVLDALARETARAEPATDGHEVDAEVGAMKLEDVLRKALRGCEVDVLLATPEGRALSALVDAAVELQQDCACSNHDSVGRPIPGIAECEHYDRAADAVDAYLALGDES